jgi:acetyltransferase
MTPPTGGRRMASWQRDQLARARDGSPVHIRDVRPDDEGAIRRLLETLSERSVYQRFLSCSSRGAQRYTHSLFDPERTLDAVVASMDEHVVGVGSTHRTGAHSAEFALAIADHDQGHGVGTLLLEALVQRARAKALQRLEGEVLAGNEQMLDVLRHLGLRVAITIEQGIAAVILDLHETPEHLRAAAARAVTANGPSAGGG